MPYATDYAIRLAQIKKMFREQANQPITCWKCKKEVQDDPELEKCPHCGADTVPF